MNKREALKNFASEQEWALGSGVMRSTVTKQRAGVMEQAAEELGLPCRSLTGTPGKSYTIASSVGLHRGVFEEGDVVIQINIGDAGEKMDKFWARVDELTEEEKQK
jgi:hypothetical protein